MPKGITTPVADQSAMSLTALGHFDLLLVYPLSIGGRDQQGGDVVFTLCLSVNRVCPAFAIRIDYDDL